MLNVSKVTNSISPEQLNIFLTALGHTSGCCTVLHLYMYILLNFYICVFALLCTCLVCSLACSGMVGPEKWLQLGEKCNKFDKFPAAVILIFLLLYSMMIMTIILVLIISLTNVTSGVKKQVYKAWLMR